MRQTPIYYDVCVIGSGAAGGVIAKELCEGGAKVIMLEAGREVPLGKFNVSANSRFGANSESQTHV